MTTGYCASLYKCGILRTRMPLSVVTVVNFPSRTGWKTESNGSALCRTLCTSGTLLDTKPDALLVAYWRRCLENSDSVAKDDWTDIIVSEDRYAILATVTAPSASLLPFSSLQQEDCVGVYNGGAMAYLLRRRSQWRPFCSNYSTSNLINTREQVNRLLPLLTQRRSGGSRRVIAGKARAFSVIISFIFAEKSRLQTFHWLANAYGSTDCVTRHAVLAQVFQSDEKSVFHGRDRCRGRAEVQR